MEKIIINKNAIKTRMFTTSEIGRGIGIHKAKKGNGSYTRKDKHKKQYDQGSDYTVFYAYN